MRLLSRVIKASDLVVLEPSVVISRAKTHELPRLMEVAHEEKHLVDTEPAVSFKEEADRILKETEVMVQELIDGARNKASAILEQARLEADSIQLKAQDEIEQAIKDGFESGYQEGYQAGQQKGLLDCEELRNQAQAELEKACEDRLAVIKASEQEIIDLALTIAGKIVGYEVKVNQEAIVGIVNGALNKVTDRQELIIKVNTADLNKVIILEEEIHREFQGIKELRIVGDEFIQQGGCEIETLCGSVDARVESQLARIKEVIMGVM